jgi:hypothetical protein
MEVDVGVEETIENGLAVPSLWIVSLACGVVVPMPVRRVGKINRVEVPVKEKPLAA